MPKSYMLYLYSVCLNTHHVQPKLFDCDGIGSGGDSVIILHNTQRNHRLQEPQSGRIFPH